MPALAAGLGCGLLTTQPDGLGAPRRALRRTGHPVRQRGAPIRPAPHGKVRFPHLSQQAARVPACRPCHVVRVVSMFCAVIAINGQSFLSTHHPHLRSGGREHGCGKGPMKGSDPGRACPPFAVRQHWWCRKLYAWLKSARKGVCQEVSLTLYVTRYVRSVYSFGNVQGYLPSNNCYGGAFRPKKH